MAPQKTTLLLVVGGVLLLTNPFWLVPHEGDTRYTYDRSEIIVRNGTLTYNGATMPDFDEENSLNAVDCQPPDDEHPRACGFDAYLATHEPVTLSDPPWRGEKLSADFVQLDNTYYRRLHRTPADNGTATLTYAVVRVTPQTVLQDAATKLSGSADEDYRTEIRVVLSGESVTTFTELEESELGNIYRVNGSYYTVVRTGEQHIDHGLTPLQYELPRYLLMIGGALVIVSALYRYRTSG